MPRPDESQPDTAQRALHAVEAATASDPLDDASVYIADPMLRAQYLELKRQAHATTPKPMSINDYLDLSFALEVSSVCPLSVAECASNPEHQSTAIRKLEAIQSGPHLPSEYLETLGRALLDNLEVEFWRPG